MTTNTKALEVLPLVERLRAVEGIAFRHEGKMGIEDADVCLEAADTIERQDTNLARMREALERIARGKRVDWDRVNFTYEPLDEDDARNIARQALAERGRG